jgi:hypothetical protein
MNNNINKKGFDFNAFLRVLFRSNENTTISFFHRYIFKEDNPNILLTLCQKLMNKLFHMGIVDEPEVKFNGNSLENARTEFESGNKKFYKKKTEDEDDFL